MNIPQHVAIILDGNGRWAKAKGLPRTYGHTKGCENLERICDVAIDLGIKYLTVYAFSTENWKRDKAEVEALMKIFRGYLKKCKSIADRNQVCIKIIGDPQAFDPDIQQSIKEVQEYSARYDRAYFIIALNYGSRDELRRAVTGIVQDAKEGRLSGEITEELIGSYLDTAGIPDPDLMIRTSGEQRLSNYLLWQLAYSEFYFTPVAWPDFDREELIRAIEAYNDRDRRYGGVK